MGRPDNVVAAETLANHIRCNNSFVYALFQAQFRSSLTCPQCRCQSNTFDPFLCVSVPMPQTQRRPVYVTVLYTSQQPRQVSHQLILLRLSYNASKSSNSHIFNINLFLLQVKLGITLPTQSYVHELREALASDTKIDANHMLITEIDHHGFNRTIPGKYSDS